MKKKAASYWKSKLLYCFLLFIFYQNSILAQTPTGISIVWDFEVGCQVYSQTYPPRGEKGSVFLEDIQDGVCIKVCENSTVNYILFGISETNTVNWNVVGGNITNQNNNSCSIDWGNFGDGSISFDILNSNNEIILTKTICFEKIIKPIAAFSIMPFTGSDSPRELYGCTNQIIYFTNQSTPNSGTGLVNYFWDFGDNSYSTAFEPNHTYSSDGTYTVMLTVTNACGCSVSIKKVIFISVRGFNIECPGVVCDNQLVTYSLPLDVESVCREHYNWSALGGVITNINQQNGDVTVNWNHTDASGFGYVTFSPNECGLACLLPTTIKIPVIQTNGSIQGNTHICLNNQGRYTLPQWPTTDFQWEIVGNTNNNLAIVIPTDQRNEVIIQPLVTGILTLRVTYLNTLLNCGGTATLTIMVDSFNIEGFSSACVNTTNHYNLSQGMSSNWTLTNSSNTIIDSLTNSNSYSYNFTQAGTYVLSVTGSAQCQGSQRIITVLDPPAPPVATGELSVCPNVPYTYSVVNPDPMAQYSWQIVGGNGAFLSSSVGSTVTIQFYNVPNIQVLVYQQKQCLFTPGVLNISLKTVPAAISSANGSVFGNTYTDYNAIQYNSNPEVQYTGGETYTWSITPPYLGSITWGQGTNNISVLWNNVAVNTSPLPQATLNLIIGKCTLPIASRTFAKQVTINPVLQIGITTNNTTVCSGVPITFHIVSTNLGPIDPNATVTWNFDGHNIIGTVNQVFTFSNIGSVSVLQNITAFIANANGSGIDTNTASLPMTIAPQPPATLSISSGGNVFCPPNPINTILTASTLTGATIQWWFTPFGSNTPTNTGQTANTFNCSAYGTYYFVATNSLGCSTNSNLVVVSQLCLTDPPCLPPANLVIDNNASNNCGLLSLNGSVSPTPLDQYWVIVGPEANYGHFTGTSLNVKAGEFNTFYNAVYPCLGSTPVIKDTYRKVTVPYIADFAYTKVCKPNNTFDIVLIDKSNFFTPVINRSILYYIKPAGGNYTLTSGTAFNLPIGTYSIKIVISGDLNGSHQPPCEKECTIVFAGVPNQSITSSIVKCHDSSVKFNTTNSQIGDSYLWTFEPGTPNEATNTLAIPQRVFPSSGVKTVTVTITNKYGCSRTLSTQVTIPNKCFNGTVVASAPSACVGSPVTLQYVPTANECSVTNYIWMDGSAPIYGAPNASAIQVYTPGMYWVEIQSANNCVYDTPNRVTPFFKPVPTVHLEGPFSVCSNTAITINAVSNANYFTWTLDNIQLLSFAGAHYVTLDQLAAGTHILEIDAFLDGCSSHSSRTITVLNAPEQPIITQEIFCTNDDPQMPFYHVVLHATSNVSGMFNWYNGQNGDTITVTDGGPYKVMVYNGNCSATTQTDVPKNPEDFIWIFPTGCMSKCFSESTTPTIIGPNLPLTNWNWTLNDESILNGQDSFPTPIGVNHSGTYNLEINTGQCSIVSPPLNYQINNCEKCKLEVVVKEIIKNSENHYCSFDVSLNIFNGSGSLINATIIAPNNDVVVVPSSLQITAGTAPYHIQLIPIGNFTGGLINLQIIGTTKEGKPCIYEFSIDLPSCIQETGKGATSSKTDTNNRIVIAPNPAKEQVTINYNELNNNSTIEVYDLTGRALANYTITTTSGSITIPTSSYPVGVYIVVVKTGTSLVTQQKLIIE